jgi:amino acid adenylation domain-containing protein
LQKSQLGYWEKQLDNSLPDLNLPTDHPRSTFRNYRGAKYSFIIPKNISNELKNLSQREGVTFFMTLLSAFNIFLYRDTGQFDLPIGVPVANRNRIEFEKLIGFFLNTVVLRTDLSGNPSFLELLQRVKTIALEAFAHQDLPFEKLVEYLRPERDPSHTPLFQTWFVYQEFPRQPLELSGLDVNRLLINTDTAMFDLSLSIFDTEDELIGTFGYNSDLFNQASIARMVDQFQILLESIAADPGKNISNLDLISEDEQKQHSESRNINHRKLPYIEFGFTEVYQSIFERFEQQVEMHPDNIAIKENTNTTSYKELDLSANAISWKLLSLSERGEGRVALLFEHGASMIEGIFGALMAGKTYVPLDPNYPKERLEYILDDSQSKILLTNNYNLEFANEFIKDDLLLLNVDQIEPASSKNHTSLSITPDSVAYILYTSGSLGQPKGVMQSHKSVLHHIRNYTNNLHINVGDKLLLLASYSFDAAVMDIYTALLNGGTLIPFDIKKNGLDGLHLWINQEEVTIYHSTPTVYRYFIDSIPEDVVLPTIRCVVLGGEEVFKRDLDNFKRHFSEDCIFVNLYGSTESSFCTQFFANHDTEITRNSVPIGFPVDGIEILLLDEQGNDSKVYGEISIRSPQVALGYWDKPSLTKESFYPDPFDRERRIYRSGDLGHRTPDGNIICTGRKDKQVKIRGYRIEPGEIELELNKHPSIRETSVIAHEPKDGEKVLIAYFVSNHEKPVNSTQLRRFLSKKLPEYMLPAAFIGIETMPLTPTGKVDRRALPTPEWSRIDLETTYEGPRTHIEEMLVDIWSQVLGIEHIGIHDNFFDLGGHSMLAVRLSALIEEGSGRNLPLMAIYSNPTIEQQAKIILQEGKSDFSPSLVKVQSGDDFNPPFFCIPGNLGNVFTDLAGFASYLGLDQSFYGFQDGIHNPIYIEELANRYIQEIRRVQPEGPYYLCGFCFGGVVAFEMAQQLQNLDQEVALLALVEPASPRKPSLRSPFEFTRSFLRRVFRRFGYQSQRVSELSYHELKTYIRLKVKLLANEWGLLRYAPQLYRGKLHLFLTSETLKSPDNHRLRWRKFADGGIELHEFPGTHNAIVRGDDPEFDEASMKVLAELLMVSRDKSLNRPESDLS